MRDKKKGLWVASLITDPTASQQCHTVRPPVSPSSKSSFDWCMPPYFLLDFHFMWTIWLVSGAAVVSPTTQRSYSQMTYNSENQVFCLDQCAIKKGLWIAPVITAPLNGRVILFAPQFLFLRRTCLIGAWPSLLYAWLSLYVNSLAGFCLQLYLLVSRLRLPSSSILLFHGISWSLRCSISCRIYISGEMGAPLAVFKKSVMYIT